MRTKKAPEDLSKDTPKESIWDGINRQEFESQLINLAGTRQTQDLVPSQLAPEDDKGDTGQSDERLPLAIENRLAEGFAFLAAWKSDPGCVSAATIASSAEHDGLFVVLAANDGVASAVQNTMHELRGYLQRCALLRMSRNDCTQSCLESIARLHRQRIRGRLIVKKGAKTVYIACRLRSLSETLRQAKNATKRDRKLLSDELKTLANLMEVAQSKFGAGDQESALIELIQKAFAVTLDGVSLRRRLASLKLPSTLLNEIMESREAREVQALANYWRICESLTWSARFYRRHFSNFQVLFVEPDVIQKWPPKIGIDLHVHAEIQLLVFHELSTTLRKPRALTASKQACFLCSTFIRSHGVYSVADSHGEVHRQWTVPDRKEYTDEQRASIRTALRKTAVQVQKAASRLKQALVDRDNTKAQSKINLTLDLLLTPSVSTLKSDNGARQSINREETTAVQIEPEPTMTNSLFRIDSGMQSAPDIVIASEKIEEPETIRDTSGPQTPIFYTETTEQWDSGDDAALHKSRLPTTNATSSPIAIHAVRQCIEARWLAASIGSEVAEDPSPPYSENQVCSINLADSDRTFDETFDANETADPELTFARPIGKNELRILMTLKGHKDLIMTVTWPA